MTRSAKNISEFNNLLQKLDKMKLNKNSNHSLSSIHPLPSIIPLPIMKKIPQIIEHKSETNLDNQETDQEKTQMEMLIRILELDYNNSMLNSVAFHGIDPRPNIKKYKNINKNGIQNKTIIRDNNNSPPPLYLPTFVQIEALVINNIDDLLVLIEKYPFDVNIKYNINMKSLHKIKEPLIQLNEMIGMKSLKETIVEQILYFVQGFHNGDFMHTVIYGAPGTGKTEIAKLMGQIYCKMGILDKGVFKKVTRSDLVAGYLGQTAMKTKDVINECLGGVLFIDEAYSLGNNEKRDSYSKECIDTLCEALSNHKENLMVIIAGYETELKECFFNYNQGLDSRFTWRFKTDDYKASDLCKIFLKKVNDIGWKMESPIIEASWFEKKMDYFKFFGRDMEILLSKIKIAHSKRVFCSPEVVKKTLNMKDVENGYEIYLKNDEVSGRSKEKSNFMNTIYI